jgi:hypothetical protein
LNYPMAVVDAARLSWFFEPTTRFYIEAVGRVNFFYLERTR